MSYGKEIITEIAKLYYEKGMTQAEVSTRLGISRPIVHAASWRRANRES